MSGPHQSLIQYQFSDGELLQQALSIAGSPDALHNFSHCDGGNKSLALIGDAVIRLVIVEEGLAQGKTRGSCERSVQNLACNESLDRRGQEVELSKDVCKNPCQRGAVPKVAMASTVEAIIGAAWVDCGRDFGKIREIVKVSLFK